MAITKDIQRSTLGMTDYYKEFVKNFGMIAQPLTNMLKKDSFNWTKESEKTFQELKLAMTTTPVLTLPDFSKEFVVECDASGNAIGAVLSQANHPIAFVSKTLLAQKHLALPVYDKEIMDVMLVVQHWHP